MPFIELKNVSFKYPSKQAIHQLSLSIEKGEWVAVVGPNGSGKSTLAKLIIGLLTPQSGEIFVEGRKLTPESVHEVREKIGREQAFKLEAVSLHAPHEAHCPQRVSHGLLTGLRQQQPA